VVSNYQAPGANYSPYSPTVNSCHSPLPARLPCRRCFSLRLRAAVVKCEYILPHRYHSPDHLTYNVSDDPLVNWQGAFSMKAAILSVTAFFALILSSAALQAPQTALIVNKMSGAYRSLQSFQDSASVTRTIGRREFNAKLSLISQRPNKYLLELKGE